MAKNKLLNIDIKGTIFSFNWASGTILLAAIVGCIYFFTANKSLKNTIINLQSENKTLTKKQGELEIKVSKLEGSNETYNKTIQVFMENPPGQMNKRIEKLEEKIKNCDENRGTNEEIPDSTFINRRPPQ